MGPLARALVNSRFGLNSSSDVPAALFTAGGPLLLLVRAARE